MNNRFEIMRKIIFFSILISAFVSCKSNKDPKGELVGVPDRKEFFENDPYGMTYIPMGSFTMGPNDEDVAFAITAQAKTVSVDPFWMDITEITNNEYRQFVFWVRDSITRRMLVKAGIDGYKAEIDVNKTYDGYDHDDDNTCYLNWEKEIEWDNATDEYQDAIKDIFLPVHERFYRRKEVDANKLIYEYYWVDLKQAAKKSNRYNFNEDYTGGEYKGEVINSKGVKEPLKDRSSFIMSAKINAYPDTLVWMADYTYSYNEPYAKSYFWHPAFDNYPVVGVTWKQANAFCIWRTEYMRNYLAQQGQPAFQDFRLPTEAEWEYAARGGLMLSMYPWGGPYTRNNTGCFIANFKPLRGNYGDDGANETLPVASFSPNEWGLYDMAGNVAEWTSNAFDESTYSFTHDLNPDYVYNALSTDPPALKRKVIRGGSWKDIGFYMQVGTRTYEYQDTAKSYVGFRCVRSYLGRDAEDWDFSKFN
jgi:formylglycine-generating enzyme